MPVLGNQNEVGVKISTKADNKGIDSAESRLQTFSKRAQEVGKIVAVGFLGMATAAAGFGLSSIKLAADMEQTQIAFKTLLGDGEKARQFLLDLRKDAAKSPFEIEPIIEMNQALLGAGLAAEKSRITVMQLGNVLAATGKGTAELKRIGNTISQVYGKGKADTVDFKELVNAGWVSVKKDVADTLGITMLQLEDMVTDGVIGFEELSQSLNRVAGDAGKYGTAMEDQSQTINGLLSTLKDNVKFTMADIGKTLIDTFNIKDLVGQAILFVESFGNTFKTKIAEIGPAIEDIKQKIQDFTNWVKDNRDAIEATATVIGIVLLPQLIAMSAMLTKNIALWAIHALVSLATNIKNMYMFITSGWQMVAVLTAKGVVIAANTLKWIAYNTVQTVTDLLTGRLTFSMIAQKAVILATSAATGVWTVAQWALNVALTANPIGLIIIAIVALGAILLVASGRWTWFKDKALEAIQPIINWVQKLIEWIKSIPTMQDIGKKINMPSMDISSMPVPSLDSSQYKPMQGPVMPAAIAAKNGGTNINQTNNIYNQVDMTAAMRDLGWQLNL